MWHWLITVWKGKYKREKHESVSWDDIYWIPCLQQRYQFSHRYYNLIPYCVDYFLRFLEIELRLPKIWYKDGVNFLLFSLYFTSYFAQYIQICLADIRYLLLWCITIYILFRPFSIPSSNKWVSNFGQEMVNWA